MGHHVATRPYHDGTDKARGATWRLAPCPSHGGADLSDVSAREPSMTLRNGRECYFYNYGCEDVIFVNTTLNNAIYVKNSLLVCLLLSTDRSL